MKLRSLIGGGIITLTVILTLILMIQLQQNQLRHLDYTHEVNGNKQYRIAILTHVHVPQVDAIINRFNATLKRANLISYQTRFYCAKGDTSLLRDMISDIVDSEYDLIWSIGTSSSRALKTLCKRRGCTTPILCSNVIDYMWNRWMTKNTFLQKHMSGSIGGFNWKNRMKVLKYLHPNMKHALIPYSSSANSFYKVIDQLKETLSEMQLTSTIILAENYDALSKMRPYLDNADAIILTRDVKLLQMLPSIIKMADQRGIPIFTSDTNSVEKGCAFGIGMDEGMSGTITAEQVLHLLYDGKTISEISPINLDDCAKHFRLNRTAITTQLPGLSPSTVFIIDRGFITRNNESIL